MDDIREKSDSLSAWNYIVWFLWDFTTLATQWNEEATFPVEISNIRWLQWKFQELVIKFWSSYIKIDINWERIRNYRSKTGTKNRRWKWFKWVTTNPSDSIKAFLEEKLSAKFA
jgi:hypothetical protein